MLANETVTQLSHKMQTSELNIRREYFQHLFLSLFYMQEGMDQVYFKGGTALRLVYNSPRFSEDLDFDSPLADVRRIENAVIATLSEAQKTGIETTLDEAKETAGGYLSAMRFSAFGYTVPIRIEVSFRDKTKHGSGAFIRSEFFPEYTLVHLAQEKLVSGKLRALLDRKKPRDFYDFYFLLRSNMLPTKKGEIMQEVLDALHTTHINFDKELREFLPKNHHLIIRDFETTLEREIKRFL